MNIRTTRIGDELTQAWIVAAKDVKVYYLRPGMIMFGFFMPFFLFFSFSVRREMAAEEGLARLLALTLFFTAAAAGPFIIPMERRLGTYDRLLAAPMSLWTLLLGKTAVGAFFAIVVASLSALVGVLFFKTSIAQPGLLAAGILLGGIRIFDSGVDFWVNSHSISRRRTNAQHPASLGITVHQRRSYRLSRDVHFCTRVSLFLTPHLRHGFDESRRIRRRLARSVAGYGRVTADKRLILAAVVQAA